MAPKIGGCTLPMNPEVLFSDILATANRLNTLYGLETRHVQFTRHVGIIQKVWRHIRQVDVLMTSSISDFFVILRFFATDFVLLNYDVIIVEKVPFPVLAYLK